MAIGCAPVMTRSEDTFESLPLSLSTLLLRQGLSLNLKFAGSAGLAGQRGLGPLHPPQGLELSALPLPGLKWVLRI